MSNVQVSWLAPRKVRQMVVVGSNTHVAWGFTNTYADWSDIVLLETDAYIRDFLVRWGANGPVSTAELHYALGRDLLAGARRATPAPGLRRTETALLHREIADWGASRAAGAHGDDAASLGLAVA